MSSNNYQIYINQILQLAETIVIKSSYTAEALNEWVYGVSGFTLPIDPDPYTWKYYLNLAGQYHEIDREMTVVSMDTLERIAFNSANLKIHRATARAYQYGTRQYNELLTQYPDQETLILGILHPVDIKEAIEAPDGQILTYPKNLVEENEYSLIPRLQDWINQFKARWFIPAYTLTDELYTATHLAIMHLLMVQAIATMRIASCNTNEAHSFHIRQYLGSHGYLDSYMDTLTKRQALYFYRNIAYLERNAGKRDTFDLLTEHIMTERSIPLAEYSMKHDVSKQVEEIYPEVIFRAKQLNLGIVLPPNNQTSLPQLLAKQMPLAVGNSEDLPAVQSRIRMRMENSSSNVVATKALESSMVDESNSSPWVLSEILFNHWIYLSSENLYTAYIAINNPRTGEKIPLTAKEAFIFAMYAYARSMNVVLDTVPLAYASRVQRLPTVANPFQPSADDIHSIVDPTLVPYSAAVTALAIQPNIGNLISTDAFYSAGLAINDAVQMQRRLIGRQQHHVARGMVEAMVTRIYSDHIIALEPEGTVYANWLSNRNINVTSWTRAEFDLLYADIVGQATGMTLHPTQSVKELQSQMVAMFTQLSSYGIQVIKEINDSSIRKLDTPYVRLGATHSKLHSHLYLPTATANVQRLQGRLRTRIPVRLNRMGPNVKITTHTTNYVKSNIGLSGDMSHEPTEFKMRATLSTMRVTAPDPTVDIPRGWSWFLGIESILGLTTEQLASMADVYNGQISSTPAGSTPLSSVILITELASFDLGERPEQLSRSIRNRSLGEIYPKEP